MRETLGLERKWKKVSFRAARPEVQMTRAAVPFSITVTWGTATVLQYGA
jgi:hypothetical protein